MHNARTVGPIYISKSCPNKKIAVTKDLCNLELCRLIDFQVRGKLSSTSGLSRSVQRQCRQLVLGNYNHIYFKFNGIIHLRDDTFTPLPQSQSERSCTFMAIMKLSEDVKEAGTILGNMENDSVRLA